MEVRDNQLFIGDTPAGDIALQYPTPLYVYDEQVIRNRIRELKECITYESFQLYYACKANTNHEILKIIHDEGCNIDAVSPGEILAALNAGFKSDEILYTSNNVTDDEMKYALEKGVLINIDSISQLKRLGQLAPGSNICVRINPDFGAGHHDHCITGGPESKFGIYFDKVDEIKQVAADYDIRIIGLHEHIGTGILDSSKFITAMQVLLDVANKFPDLEFIDFGGGIGIPYEPDQDRLPIKEFGAEVSNLFSAFCDEYGRKLRLILEPGRYIVAEAGALLSTVNTVKPSPKHLFVGVNTGFNHLIRPTMYGSYHHIIKISEVSAGISQEVAICGNICESGDVFTREEDGIADRSMPPLSEGDVLAIMDAGAYGYAMASVYNSRPRPAEVLVNGTDIRMIRPPDRVEDII